MLDRLLGRRSLKERIAELEAENEDLRRELDAESERRADAATERQRAEREVNQLEDRVEQLEDRIERLQGEAGDLSFRREERLRGERRDEVLDRLGSVETEPEGAFTAYVTDEHDLPRAVHDAFGDRAALVSRATPCLAVTDDAGVLAACLSVPAPPDPFTTWADEVAFERSWFAPSGAYALALVRSDLFALGEFDGRERTAFHGFDSDLQRNHSKGGFSQARFERLRDEQIDTHLERCRAALAERTVDPLYVVGERSVLAEFEDEAERTMAVDATGDPESALADAVDQFWTVSLRVP